MQAIKATLTPSDHLGYGEKQDEIFLLNYTVAKATIVCDFQLESSYYNCFEIDDLDINDLDILPYKSNLDIKKWGLLL